ncbi:peptidoglycan bridge formation glycyltransferase FemA/FemB family protein [Candidatus Parcubacteria bacterium]|nr:peptidoglycan bridge formation glycyltransferase FemA/FemB family protein [Candidatus Parcubacteria bacterium]
MSLIDPTAWNGAILGHPDGSFLQSYEWGEFQQAYGRPVFRFALASGARVQAVCMPLPFGFSYAGVSRGPVGEVRPVELRLGLAQLTALPSLVFVRFEPSWSSERRHEFAAAGFLRTVPTQPEMTWVVDLGVSEHDVLSGMHPKTRYNIRLAQRHGVEIIETGAAGFKVFRDLLRQTGEREGFRTHDPRYYELMAEHLLVEAPRPPFVKPQARIFCAQYRGDVLAVAFILFFGQEAVYLHGGSAAQYRDVMAPHLLHWEIIRRAKALGCTRYNLWGIAPRSGAMASPHDQARRASSGAMASAWRQARRASSDAMYPWQSEQMKQWAGFTRFKQSFGGRPVEYMGAWDLPVRSTWYRLYQLARRIRRQAVFF